MSLTDFYLSIDFSKLTPIEDMFGGDFEETQQLTVLFEEAELYLSSFNWCQGIKSVYFGLGVSGIIGIFLFEILPSESSVDRYFWVVAGDTPPAHLPTVDLMRGKPRPSGRGQERGCRRHPSVRLRYGMLYKITVWSAFNHIDLS